MQMQNELTKTPIIKKFFGDKAFYKMVIAVALPIILQNGITNFVSFLDNIMVGQVGTEEMSGVAIVNQLFFIFMLACFGICSGAGIFTAQFHGKKDDEGIRQTFRIKLIASLLLSIFVILLYFFLQDQLIGVYLNDGSQTGDLAKTLGFAKDYLKILFIGFLPYAITQAYASTLRETEHAALPTIAAFVAVVVNCIGNYILIFGKLGCPVLGVRGAAISTVVSRFVELIIVIIAVHTQKKRFTFAAGVYVHFFTISKDLILKFMKKGFPLFINEVLWAVGMSILAQAYSERGLAAVAGYNIASTVLNLFNIVHMALGNSVGIIIGKYLGQGDNETAIDYDRKMITFAVLAAIVCGGIMCAVSGAFPAIYNTTDEVKDIAQMLIIIAGASMPVASFMHSCYFTLRSGGRTFITFLFDSAFVCVVSVPMALILAHFTNLEVIYMFLIVTSLDIAKSCVGMIFLLKKIWLNKLV